MVDIISLISAFVLLAINIVQLVKTFMLKKDVEKARRVANITDLKNFLYKPLEGTWQVDGLFEKYHGSNDNHRAWGVATFTWNENSEKYDVFYAYSTQKENSAVDLVTSICTGSATCEKNGDVGATLTLRMDINRRTAADNYNANSRSFVFVSKKINRVSDKITGIQFPFATNDGTTKGNIYFRR